MPISALTYGVSIFTTSQRNDLERKIGHGVTALSGFSPLLEGTPAPVKRHKIGEKTILQFVVPGSLTGKYGSPEVQTKVEDSLQKALSNHHFTILAFDASSTYDDCDTLSEDQIQALQLNLTG